MKKILFCAAVAAMATACTNEDDLILNKVEKGCKGLTFDVSLAENAVTRGELWRDDNGTYPFFWYAENDRIDVQTIDADTIQASGFKGMAKVAKSTGLWTLGAAASYKATVSAGNGQFTAASDADMLGLAEYDNTNAVTRDTTTATIVATYGISASAVTSNTTGSGTAQRPIPGSIKKLTLTTTGSNATQNVDRPNQVIAPMYSVSSAKKENVYDSFGEKAKLKMVRPFPVVRFTTQNTANYINDLGQLKSVTLTMLGEDADTTPLPKSSIAYVGSKTYTVIGDEADLGAGSGFTTGSSDNVVTVNLADGTWTDNDAVYMTVAPVDRSAFRTKGVKEGIKIVYTFDNITFTLDPTRDGAADFEKILMTDNDWTAVDAQGNPNAVTPLPALDINNYNYLVTGSGTNQTLIVVKGTFSEAFLSNGNVNWGPGVAKSNITKIRSAVALTSDELAMLKNFNNLTELELSQNTVIPANTFSAAQAVGITKLNLPMVTEVKSKFINNNASTKFSALTDLNLASYNFPDATINKSFFASTTSTLVNLNISSVQTMLPTFGLERELNFKNFSALKTVKVYNGVQLSASAFENCPKLNVVDGEVNINGAVNAFALNAANSGDWLVNIKITGTDIPNGAFKNRSYLQTITKDGLQVAPTTVGDSAFESCRLLSVMNLSNVTVIGENAFKGTTLLKGNNTETKILTVGAAKISKGAFDGSGVEMVDFTNATSIEPGIFANANSLKQVRFHKAFTGVTQNNASDWNNTFGTSANVVLFVDKSQAHVKSNKLELPYWVNAATKDEVTYTEMTFKGIYNN